MNFDRHLKSELLIWKEKDNRKPLLLRGARQVGKTTLVNEFSKSYSHYISLNLEKPNDLRYFQDYTDINKLGEALFINNNIAYGDRGKTLLFIDEIQESPEAIKLLRYFYEDIPNLHVIAAGSLLEHVMGTVTSYPVGRVDYLYLSPLNFLEYLSALGHNVALEQMDQVPINTTAHQTLQDLFHTYAIIGGMPEVVLNYLSSKNIADLPKVYESIWSTYKDDIKKYASNAPEARIIKYITDNAYLYIDQRIKFQNFGKSNYRSREVGEAFRNLNDAKIIQLIYPTVDTSLPIKPNLRKSPRLQFLDTGLINYELQIQAQMLAMNDLNTAYKGAIIPHLIMQELISLNTINYRKPHFWVRDKSQASAEIDIVVPYKDMLIPIEVKSGKVGTLKSLHEFVERVEHSFAIRMYAGKFSIEEHKTPNLKKTYFLMNLPYYLGTKLDAYMSYFIDERL